MPNTPFQQTWPSLAARKRIAAAKRESEAARMRAEADELDRRWRAYVVRRDTKRRLADQTVVEA